MLTVAACVSIRVCPRRKTRRYSSSSSPRRREPMNSSSKELKLKDRPCSCSRVPMLLFGRGSAAIAQAARRLGAVDLDAVLVRVRAPSLGSHALDPAARKAQGADLWSRRGSKPCTRRGGGTRRPRGRGGGGTRVA